MQIFLIELNEVRYSIARYQWIRAAHAPVQWAPLYFRRNITIIIIIFNRINV